MKMLRPQPTVLEIISFSTVNMNHDIARHRIHYYEFRLAEQATCLSHLSPTVPSWLGKACGMSNPWTYRYYPQLHPSATKGRRGVRSGRHCRRSASRCIAGSSAVDANVEKLTICWFEAVDQ